MLLCQLNEVSDRRTGLEAMRGQRRELTRGEFLRLAAVGTGAALADLGIARAADLGLHADTRVDYTLNARTMRVNLGGRTGTTMGFNNLLPGPEIRLKRGDTLHAAVNNELSESTSVHWHGMPIVNRMDGVPGLTQKPIAPGASFLYKWKAPVSGTYWYHSHSSTQNDRALYGPLIIDDPQEQLHYDREHVLVLDDWRDVARTLDTRDDLYECYPAGLSDRPDVVLNAPAAPDRYPLYLINGRPPNAPAQFQVKKGDVVRLRIINAGAATVFRVAIDGHRMRVTHTDGQAVKPVDVDVLEIGMAERYDVLVYATNPGTWQIAAWVNGFGVTARALLHYTGSRAHWPGPTYQPPQMTRTLLTYPMLQAASGVPTPQGKPDLIMPVELKSRYGAFWLTWNGQIADSTTPIPIPLNKHIRLIFKNNGSSVVHPMHLHGNFFQVMTGTGSGPMKDTIRVYPFESYTVDWMSTNPGLWMLHCHNLYHMLAGMMLIFNVS